MQEGSFYFSANLESPIALVLQPSSLIENWQKIFNLGRELINKFPGKINEIFFLGNRQPYQILIPSDYEAQVPGWYSRNKGRISLITPIIETLHKENFKGMMVVISFQEPIDFYDWEGTEVFKQIIRLNPDEPIDWEDVQERLDNPVKDCFIKSPGFVPLRFEFEDKGVVPEREKVKVLKEKGSFVLQLPTSIKSIQFHIESLFLKPPLLFIKRENETEEVIRGSEELPWFEKIQWQNVPENVAIVVKAGILKQGFKCPQCGEEHNYNVLKCPSGGIILRGIPTQTTVLFKEENGSFKYFPLIEHFAYPLMDKRKIVTNEGEIYEWDEERWCFIKKLSSYEEVEKNVWALFHRI
jgi:hypothetical protein